VVQVHYDEGVAIHIGPEPCVGVRKDADEASVGEGIGQPLSRESQSPDADAVSSAEGNTFRTHHRKVRTARRGRRTWHVQKLLGREPGDPTSGQLRCPLWPASGRRGAVADDERTWEVRLRNSSCEQSRATGCGVGGAKGGGRGECEPAKHAPGAGPGKCVTGAGAHTASPLSPSIPGRSQSASSGLWRNVNIKRHIS